MWASITCGGLRILRNFCVSLPPFPFAASSTSSSLLTSFRALASMDKTDTKSSSFSSSIHSGRRDGRGRGSEMKDNRERSRGSGSGGKDKIDALGRLLTRVLRHMASELNLNMRSDGYVRVQDLLKLNVKTFANIPLRLHTVDDIREAVRKDNKQRFSLLEENGELLIRANQGHTITTVETESLLKPILSAEEVPVCVHGTYKKFLESILEHGLKRMKRLHVHFSCGLPTDGEVISGLRRDVNVLIFLDVRKALEEGMKLYISDNKSPQKILLGMRACSEWRRFLLCFPLIFFLPHIFSVLELHQKTTMEDLHKKQTKKFDHLVLGPAAGEGLHDRLQCQGIKALNKTSNNSNFGESIAFVTVFTTYSSSIDKPVSGRSRDLVTVGNISYDKVERSMAILNVFINFIQVTMPKSNIFILTDPASTLPVHRNRVTLYPIQGQYSRDKLMLQRIKSYIAFLETRLKEHSQQQEHINHYIFTDSDIAVVGNLGKIFYNYPKFHLALTFRNNKEQPLNSGFIAVRGTRDGILRAKDFLQEVLKVYNSKYMKASRMLGDQLALAWVVKSHASFNVKRFTRPQAFLEDIGGASVLFLPCAIYNWTPPEGAGQFHGMPLDVKVVHFKGSRKRLMLESWNFLNSSSSDISDMLCLILKSGRTKYDF
ncbi:hypothetical protein F0562_019104 [Nyssa sinensis]|uniref:2'-phosphotransferase n=1 Tax=Nyssa sinensis TaxID=561372 RepID=A0A5J4ZBE3_9ASTE|nr:hypothetical protein F0562_019104 [Nyssa sinensis]